MSFHFVEFREIRCVNGICSVHCFAVTPDTLQNYYVQRRRTPQALMVAGELHGELRLASAPRQGAYSLGAVEVFMTSGQTGTGENPDRGAQWAATIGSMAVGAAFLALWFWLLPIWLGFRVDLAGAARWRWIAAVPSALGFAVALRCIWDFGWTGRGTPMPIVPPTRLVVVGFYCYVRNPMYLGFFVGWAGLCVIFGTANLVAVAGAGAAVLAVSLFVQLYEEPHLQKIFGSDYEQYCRNVRRWVPRMRAWHP